MDNDKEKRSRRNRRKNNKGDREENVRDSQNKDGPQDPKDPRKFQTDDGRKGGGKPDNRQNPQGPQDPKDPRKFQTDDGRKGGGKPDNRQNPQGPQDPKDPRKFQTDDGRKGGGKPDNRQNPQGPQDPKDPRKFQTDDGRKGGGKPDNRQNPQGYWGNKGGKETPTPQNTGTSAWGSSGPSSSQQSTGYWGNKGGKETPTPQNTGTSAWGSSGPSSSQQSTGYWGNKGGKETPTPQNTGTSAWGSSGPSSSQQSTGPKDARKFQTDDGRKGDQQGGRAGHQQHPQGGKHRTTQNTGASSWGARGPSTSQQSIESIKGKGFPGTEFQRPDTVARADVKSVIKRGTVGRVSTIETNYLTIDMSKMPKEAYHYDVCITPDRPKKFLRMVFEKFNAKYFNHIMMAFDNNKNAYSIKKLPEKELEGEVEVEDGMKPKVFKVLIKETGNFVVELDSLRSYFGKKIFEKPMRALQCLEVVFSSPCFSKGIRHGRAFYTKPEKYYDLDNGFEMWTGLFQAAILGDEPFLNVDISNKSFYSECSVIEFFKKNAYDFDPNRTMDRNSFNKLRFAIKNVDVTYTPPPNFGFPAKTYKIVDISTTGARNLEFDIEGDKTTVAKYFASKGYKLNYPDLNCLQAGTVRRIYLPIELCKIKSQVFKKTEAEAQKRKMITWSATSTNERKDKIMNALRHFNHNVDPIIRHFGISIQPKFLTITMRLIRPPDIVYDAGKEVSPSNGSWRQLDFSFLNTVGSKMSPSWAILYFDKHLPFGQIKEFARKLYNQAKQANINLEPVEKVKIVLVQNISKEFDNLKSEGYGLSIVVIPRFGTTYAEIKQQAELRSGILTQCIKHNNFTSSRNDQIISNILLKINAKLNGTNHSIKNLGNNSKFKSGVMYIGADVTHPSPDQRNIPSIVGVAASHDSIGFCYNMQIRFQKSTVEEIEDMESIVTHHLNIYFRHQKSYPKHIFYYRDGVSDGQFPRVKNIEISGFRRAFAKLRVNVKLTCIIVVKRHHTRFFPIEKTRDKYNNVPPGTVVDRVIVHPNETQFFMVSHQSVQGTAKPTRYNVIEDDENVDIDELQRLTYDLCHMFPRCNRSVSYPAPAYLAHLAAFRGRVYIEGSRERFFSSSNQPKVIADLLNKNPMYFV